MRTPLLTTSEKMANLQTRAKARDYIWVPCSSPIFWVPSFVPNVLRIMIVPNVLRIMFVSNVVAGFSPRSY